MTEAVEPAVVDDEPTPVPTDSESVGGESLDSRPTGPRRFLRFNLLTVLLLFLFVSAYFGVRQRFAVSPAETAAVKSLEEFRASVVTKPVESILLRDFFLLHGPGFEHAHEIEFGPQGTIVPPIEIRPPQGHLATLADLPELTTLYLGGLILEDGDLAEVAKCVQLRLLDARGMSINDAGIERLRTLRELREIRLSRTFTTDRSLEVLAELPKLESVYLDDSTTARGIAALARYPMLKYVNAMETSLRAEEVRPLVERGIRVSLPDVDPASYAGMTESFFAETRGANAVRVEAAPGKRLRDEALKQIGTDQSAVEVQFWGQHRIDDEAIVSVLGDPRVIRVEFPPCGTPYLYEDLRKTLDRRPAGAPYCRVYGHVLISGEDLLSEVSRGSGTAHYLLYDVTPELRGKLGSAGVSMFADQALTFDLDVYLDPTAPQSGEDDLTVPAEPDA